MSCSHGNSPSGKSTGSAKEAYFLLMFLSLPHGVKCAPLAPRNIWQLCRKISVTLNPSPAPGPSCPCAVMNWEPLCVFASPQDSRYNAKDSFLLLKFPSLHVMWLGIGERTGSLLRDPHQPLPRQSPTSHIVLWLTA